LQCYRCQAFGYTSANCYKKPRCVKCAQSHLTSEYTKSPDIPAKCSKCSGDHPSSYTQCPAYIKFLEKRTLVTKRENFNNTQVNNLTNKNLQFNRSLHDNQNFEIHECDFNSRINPQNTKRNNNKLEEKQTFPKSYAATINNNNTSMTANNEISDFNGLMFEINKLKQIVNIPRMIIVIRNLNNRLINCKDGMEKIQTFIEASEQID